jgi:predicted acyl esterase
VRASPARARGLVLPRRRLLPLLLLLVSLPLPAAAAGSEADGPYDYLTVEGLSEPVHETALQAYRVPMADGVELYVEVTMPTGGGRHPVILELSPYHGTGNGRGGLFGELVGEFAPRGYAVAIADLRGTGRSQGCLDALGPLDAADGAALVEWLAAQPWSSGRVGMIGFSYPAAAAAVTAAQHPPGLATIVPIAGLASMYDHQFQAGVPYSGQWLGTVASYPLHGTAQHLPPAPLPLYPTGDHFGGDPRYAGCSATGSSLLAGESELSGTFSPWFQARDHREGAISAPLPIFLIHGLNDSAARIPAADWFFERDMAAHGDKLWLHQGDHGLPRADAAYAALLAWFDHHLRQTGVPTGPPVEVFLADGELLQDVRYGEQNRTAVLAADVVPEPSALVSLAAGADGSLGAADPPPGQVTFTGDPRDSGLAGISTSGSLFTPDYDEQTEATGHVEFVANAVTQPLVLLGRPRLDLTAAVSAERVHLITTLYDESPSGARRRITTCAINPELRGGAQHITPVVPGATMQLEPPCFTMAHVLQPGHRLVLRTTTSNKDKFAFFAVDPRVTVVTGPDATTIHLPEVRGATLLPDSVDLLR